MSVLWNNVQTEILAVLQFENNEKTSVYNLGFFEPLFPITIGISGNNFENATKALSR